jgi:predicted  nucleic acid-binding Zn-ribbon protein
VEHSEKVRADRRGELEALRAEREQVVRETERERAQIEEQLAELGRERERLLDGVDGELLETYERILRSKEDGIALVRLRYVPGGRGRPDQYECEGCNVSTTLEVANEVIRARKPVQCPTCARLLYWEEPE